MTTVGVYAARNFDRVWTTLMSLKLHAPAARVVLFGGAAGGTEEITRPALTAYLQIPTVRTTGRAGVFNQLISFDNAEIVLFLEAGTIMAAGALERIEAALRGHTEVGLAGPSTNRAWNEQCLQNAPGSQACPEEINRFAEARAGDAGDTCSLLEPLHSLGDFCYAVKRAVIDAVGAADEGYGLGPCWEMDYKVRAARA